MEKIKILIEQSEISIEACKSSTVYSETQIKSMKLHAKLLIQLIHSMNKLKFAMYDNYKKEDIVCSLKIINLRIGHNDLAIDYENHYFSNKLLKEILTQWQKSGFIDRYYGNGWGTAIHIPFNTEYV